MGWKVHALTLGTLTLAALLSWSCYAPIPDGFSDRWGVRRLHVTLTKSIQIGRLLDRLGLMRFDEFLARYSLKAHPASPGVPGVHSEDLAVEGVPVRIRRPNTSAVSRKLPIYVYIHGGAFMIGDRYSHDVMLQELATTLDMVVVSVSYRLSPRHVWPAQLEDCLMVTKHFLKQAANYGADPSRLVLGGDSAGAHLTASVNLRLSDEGFTPLPKAHVLIYPVCQLVDFNLPSHQQNSLGPLLVHDLVLFSLSSLLVGNDSLVSAFDSSSHVPQSFLDKHRDRLDHKLVPPEFRYAPYTAAMSSHDDHRHDEVIWNAIRDAMTSPYLNVLLAPDLSAQPRTFLFTAQYDPLRDDSLLYARALRQAGVPVTHLHLDSGVHGMLRFYRSSPEGRQLHDAVVKFIAENV